MPRGDGTGPNGNGPMTGRGAGYCASTGRLGYVGPRFGRRGIGFGLRGRGWRNMFHFTGLPFWARAGSGAVAPEQEEEELKGQADFLKEALDGINKRLDEIKGK